MASSAKLEARISELETQLREAHSANATILNTISDLVIVLDRQGRVVHFNRACEETSGYTSDELKGQTFWDWLVPPEERESLQSAFGRLSASMFPQQYESYWLRKGGDRALITWSNAAIVNETGEVKLIVSAGADITEQRQTEKRLRENIELVYHLKSLIDNTNDFIGTSDLEGNILYTNPMGLAMLGLPKDADPTAAHISDYHPPEWAQKIGAEFVPVVMEKGLWTGELELQHADGSTIPASGVIVLTRDETGQPIGLGAIYRDIRSQKSVEVERLHLQQAIIEAQERAIRELSSPIIPVMEGVIVMPLIGSIDSGRAREITRALLAGVSEHRAKVVILDITGVAVVDSGVADHLNKTIMAARLKGARTIITGISDAVAETIVDLGIDWSHVDTLRDLQTGLVTALKQLGIKLNM
ncbi:MAG: PAS domain S-box protein [Anaerolineae bacterium]|nr:PAS domain S-box protein [Anaerolineae bacterium]